jgi:hypothetical protein
MPGKCQLFIERGNTHQRALETAQGLYPREELKTLSLFDSMPVSVPPIPFIKKTIPHWIALGNLFYTWGWPTTEEFIVETVFGAKKAALFLEEQAELYGSVTLVGHGDMNALIAKNLLKRRWLGSSAQKTDYLGR